MKIKWRLCLLACAVTLLAACSPDSSTKSNEPKPEVAKEQESTASKPNNEMAKKANNCSFTMGFDVWEPYQFVGFGKEIQGLDVELIHLIAEQMGCDIDYQQDSWGNLLTYLKEGKIDFVLGASITEERKEFGLFSEPYRTEEFQLYVRAEDEHRYRQASVADFVRDNNKLGIIGEYFYGDELTDLMDSKKYGKLFLPAFMGEINVARLIDGDINGFLEDSFVGASLIRRKGLHKYVAAHRAKINSGDVYVMFSKASIKPETVERFNRELRTIKNNGQYDKLLQKYSE